MFLPWIYLAGVILLPIVVLSSIPAIYPIYKFLIAPRLPLSIQYFFTDLKTLSLTLLSFCISGSLTNRLTIPNSLEDWVYLYLRQCNTESSFSSFCLSCSSPAIPMHLQFDSNICSVCDICLSDTPQSYIQFLEDDGCSQILRDVKQIANVGQTNGDSVTFSNIMKECVATFGLYVQFNIHLLSRAVIRFLFSIVRITRYIGIFYSWVIHEIVINSHVNHTRVVAILFIFLLTSILLLYVLRISVRLLTFWTRILMSFFSSTKSRSRLHVKQMNHIHQSKSSFMTPERISPKVEFRNSEIIRQQTQTTFDDEWSILFQENSDLAGLVSLSIDNSEVMDTLMRVFEILYSGIILDRLIHYREGDFICFSQYSTTTPISQFEFWKRNS